MKQGRMGTFMSKPAFGQVAWHSIGKSISFLYNSTNFTYWASALCQICQISLLHIYLLSLILKILKLIVLLFLFDEEMRLREKE